MIPFLLGLLFLSNTTIIGYLNQTMVQLGVNEQHTIKVSLEAGNKDLYDVIMNYTAGEGVGLFNNGVNISTIGAGSQTRDYEIWMYGKAPGIWTVRYTVTAKYKEDLNENRTAYWGDIQVQVIERGKLIENVDWPPLTLQPNTSAPFVIMLENVGETENRTASFRITAAGAKIGYNGEINTSFTVVSTIKPGEKQTYNFTLITKELGQASIEVSHGRDATNINDKLYYITVKNDEKPEITIIPTITSTPNPEPTDDEKPAPTGIIYVLPTNATEKDYSSLIFAYSIIILLAAVLGIMMKKFAYD